ncbi:hypothetical protein AgCh_002031 [Apium graveolens]
MKQESSDTSDGSAFVAREDLRELKKNRGGSSVSLVEADEDILLVQEGKGSKEEWMLDSGCSHHICGRREWFSSYKKCEGPNGKPVKVYGIGEVTMKHHNGRVQKLTQVRYIPELNRNLILLGKLADLGYTVMMKNTSMIELDKVSCHLEDQDTRLSPRNIQYQEVERLVSGHPPQSASDSVTKLEAGEKDNIMTQWIVSRM